MAVIESSQAANNPHFKIREPAITPINSGRATTALAIKLLYSNSF